MTITDSLAWRVLGPERFNRLWPMASVICLRCLLPTVASSPHGRLLPDVCVCEEPDHLGWEPFIDLPVRLVR